MNKIKILIILLILICIFALTSCTVKNISIENIGLSKDINEDGKPVEVTIEFDRETSEIYLTMEVKNMSKDDVLSISWFYLDEDLMLGTRTFSPEDNFTGNKVFMIKISEGFPPGNYTATLSLNDDEVKRITFLVN